MNAFKCISSASLIAALALIAGSQAARASVRITLSFDYVETEVSPHPGDHRTHVVNTYQISADKRVDFSSNIDHNKQLTLGRPMTVSNLAGKPVRVAYRIDRGAIVITGSVPSFTTVTRIVTDGHSSCSATREYFKNPGHRYFEVNRTSNNESMLDSSTRAENVSCSIAESSD